MAAYGVIIARFQVPELHSGHTYLINEVLKRHEKVVIILGIANSAPTDKNPLSYALRKTMVLQQFPDVVVEGVVDHPNDIVWSEYVDKILQSHSGEPILYGSRDSFIPHYKGKHSTIEIAQYFDRSGTDIRQDLKQPIHTSNFRAGIIYSQLNRFPIVYPTVDIVCIKEENDGELYVLLGQKKGETDWRFPGGFIDKADGSALNAAKRELIEEVGHVEVTDWICIGSIMIDDPRYRDTKDAIMTTVFMCKYMFGGPKASDDLEEVRWIHIDKVEENLNPIHLPILNDLMRNM